MGRYKGQRCACNVRLVVVRGSLRIVALELCSPSPRSAPMRAGAGKTTIHHYLFDPTEDALFDNTFHHREYPRTEISGHKLDLATSSVIELMRKQLELTEHQMRSQKALYRSFCKSLEKSQRKLNKNDKHEKVLFGRSKAGTGCSRHPHWSAATGAVGILRA